jgi:hypothetical protein
MNQEMAFVTIMDLGSAIKRASRVHKNAFGSLLIHSQSLGSFNLLNPKS